MELAAELDKISVLWGDSKGMRRWEGTFSQGRKFPGWCLWEKQVTFLSSLHLSFFFQSSQPSLGVHIQAAVSASPLNNFVAEETIKVPKEQAAEMLFIAAITLVADVVHKPGAAWNLPSKPGVHQAGTQSEALNTHDVVRSSSGICLAWCWSFS